MGGMAILEFFSIFLLSEQVRIIYLFGFSLILKRELIIGCDLCACLSIHDVINKLKSFENQELTKKIYCTCTLIIGCTHSRSSLNKFLLTIAFYLEPNHKLAF